MITLNELLVRKSMCELCINTLQEVDDKDPRKNDALKEYRRQHAEIVAAIRKIDPTLIPPDIVVGLRSAKISGSVPKP